MASQRSVSVLLIVLVTGVFAAAWYSSENRIIGCKAPAAANDAVRQMYWALEAYRQVTGSYPTTEQGLAALVSKPTKSPVPEKWQKLLDSDPTDPWGTPFIYRYRGSTHPERFELICLGPDRVRSNDDCEAP